MFTHFFSPFSPAGVEVAGDDYEADRGRVLLASNPVSDAWISAVECFGVAHYSAHSSAQ